MKDLVIGCSTGYNWSVLKYWVNSLNMCGFSGDKVLILMNCNKYTIDKLVAAGISIIGFRYNEQGDLVYSSNLPVHVERFLHIYNFLKSNNQYRYVVTTDVKDVVFQKNPIEFIENSIKKKKLILSSESMLYKDEPWGNQNLLDTFGSYFHAIFKENAIYNVGVLAGTSESIRDLCSNIFQMSLNRPIPIVDQSTFNFMISQEPYKSTCLYTGSEDGWACQLGTTFDPSKIEDFRPYLLEETPKYNGKTFTTSKGVDYYIVHQYDRTPFKTEVELKYGGCLDE